MGRVCMGVCMRVRSTHNISQYNTAKLQTLISASIAVTPSQMDGAMEMKRANRGTASLIIAPRSRCDAAASGASEYLQQRKSYNDSIRFGAGNQFGEVRVCARYGVQRRATARARM